MTTNGIGLHRLDLGKLRPGVFDHVSVSVDGVDAEVNDKTRGSRTFAKIVETIGLYRQAGIMVSINYTVTNNNIGSLHEVIPFFHDIGVGIINLHRASMDGNAYRNSDLLVDARTWIEGRDKLFDFIQSSAWAYPGLKLRIPYIFLTQEQARELNYRPIQDQNYHSPDGGHRLIVFPATAKGRGLCYMSSDMIGHENAELGAVDADGKFRWNHHPKNELVAFKENPSSNVSTVIKGQDEGVGDSGEIIRVSHSFKRNIFTDDLKRPAEGEVAVKQRVA